MSYPFKISGMESRNKGDSISYSVKFSGVTFQEIDTILGFSRGHLWIRVNKDRRLEFHKVFKDPEGSHDLTPLPSQENSTCTDPHWSYSDEGITRRVAINEITRNQFLCPSIIINGIIGDAETSRKYAEYRNLLVSYGFIVLRSQKYLNDTAWELFYLPSIYYAEGNLLTYIEEEYGQLHLIAESEEGIASKKIVNYITARIPVVDVQIACYKDFIQEG